MIDLQIRIRSTTLLELAILPSQQFGTVAEYRYLRIIENEGVGLGRILSIGLKRGLLASVPPVYCHKLLICAVSAEATLMYERM
jgi:hypothetical protein